MSPRRLAFGPFILDLAARRLTRDGQPVALPPKAMDLLVALAESPDTVLTKEALMGHLWPDTFVEDGNLPVTVFTLRKALGEYGEQFIQTAPRRGYTFVADVRVEGGDAPVPSSAPAPSPAAAAPPLVFGPPVPPRPRGVLAPVAATAAAVAALGLGYAWRPAAPSAAVAIHAVAVLPFAVDGEREQEASLGTGMAADVADRLARLPALAVRPVSSALKFGSAESAAVEAGRALAVDAVVTAELRLTARGAVVTAALTRVADGARLWTAADGGDHDLRDVAGTLAGSVTTAVAPGTAPAAGPRLSNDPAAYRAYLDGLARSAQLTVGDVAIAADRFEEAVAADPGFVEAHTALAVHLLLPASAQPTPARLARAREAARVALALAPGTPAAKAALGLTQAFGDHDWDGAGVALRQAIADAPLQPEPHLWEALRLSALARHDDALQEVGRAVDLDPTGSRVHFYRGFLLLMARRYDEAIDRLRQTPLTLGVVAQQVALGVTLAQIKQARFAEAEQTVARMLTRFPSPQARLHQALLRVSVGDRLGASSYLGAAHDATGTARVPRVMMAAVQACLGERDAAFENLAHAAADGDMRVMFAAVDPALDCARTDPRFGPLLTELGLVPEPTRH